MENVENPPGAQKAGASGRIRRSSRKSREELRRRIKRLQLQRGVLAALVVALAVSTVGLAIYGSSARRQMRALAPRAQRTAAELEQVQEKLSRATAALRESRQSVAELVSGRLPGLLPLAYQEPLPVELPLVRHVTFELVETGLECKLVVENGSDLVVDPVFTIAVFDSVGVELARVAVLDGGASLRPDEIRTFFAHLGLADGDEPRYFRITSG